VRFIIVVIITMFSMSKMQVLSSVLSVLFVVMLAHSMKLSMDSASVMQKYRDEHDTDGDKKLSKAEVARWFAKTFGKGKSDRFDAFLDIFDEDGDGSFSEEELGNVLDASDEWENAPAGFRLVGGDAFDAAALQTGIIGLVGLVVIVALYFEAFTAARAMNKLKQDLKEQQERVASRSQEVCELMRRREALEAEISVIAAQEAGKSSSAALAASAEAAQARLAELEATLAAKQAEAAAAKSGVRELREKMEANFSAYTAQNEKLRLMQQCLSLGEDKYTSEGAAMGIAVQGGQIFGSLGGSGGAEMYTVTKDLGTGRRGAFVVTSMSTNKQLAMKRYDLKSSNVAKAAELGVRFFKCFCSASSLCCLQPFSACVRGFVYFPSLPFPGVGVWRHP